MPDKPATDDKSRERAPARHKLSRRRLAQVAAIQALYQIDLNGDSAETVIAQFVQHRLGRDMDGVTMDVDRDFFVALIRGVCTRREQLDEMISAAMTAGRDPERLEVVLRAILRAGAFELIGRADVPPRVAIKEYVDLTADFFSEREPALTNAILDRIARTVRSEDLGDGDRILPTG